MFHIFSLRSFTATTLDVEESPELRISVPSSPVGFLYQIPAAEFVDCAEDLVSNPESAVHPWLTPLQLKNRARVAIQELKTLFNPRFVQFWLWMETLTGIVLHLI